MLKLHFWASLVAQWLRICCQCRRHGFDPWSGKIPHAAEQLSPCTTATEALVPRAREKPARSNKDPMQNINNKNK